ncbi:hypothetical protein E1B28_005878 [Marasmius oreades]|uniref:TOG domain-containing protein n=1 Tax=Marasmius oreades TaxID=181124 RepID=A0A9P7S5J0_9AGAR|nr:uncharacterized protein E1B28_005878 [Marasmius oreades]KAG7095091.1 hypothetical protein E1B28_005878 [Marasmius oreades]
MASQFSQQLSAIRPKLIISETEETWDAIAAAISTLVNLIRNAMPDEIIGALREFSRSLISALRSERTRLCGQAMELITAVSSELGMSFEPLLPIYLPVLLALCARANKVIVSRARTCVFSVIENTQLPAVLPYLLQNIKDKSTTLRLVAVESTIACLTGFDPSDLQKEARSQEIEAIIKIASRDANADIRKAGKKAFNAYKVALPNRIDQFVKPLTPKIRKYLEIPKPATTASSSTSIGGQPPNKKPVTPQLSSSTSAVANSSNTRSNSTSTNHSLQPPPRPVSVPPAHPTGSTMTLTASQRDAVRVAMTGAPTRPPQVSKPLSSSLMAPPAMPIRPALHLSRPPSSTSYHAAPQRPTHSRTASASSSAAAQAAPIRMQPAPVRAEQGQSRDRSTIPRQPPPQRFPIIAVEKTSQQEKKVEIPKPVPHLRSRAVSMKDLKVGSHSAAYETKDKEVLRSNHASGSKPDTTGGAQSSKSTSGLSTQASVNFTVSSRAATTKATVTSRFKPTSNLTTTTKVRSGLTAPTASSQSKTQPKIVHTKRSVAALNAKRKDTQVSSSSVNNAAKQPRLQSTKSSIDLRREKEQTAINSRLRSRTVTAPPSQEGDHVSRPPNRKETPQTLERERDRENTEDQSSHATIEDQATDEELVEPQPSAERPLATEDNPIQPPSSTKSSSEIIPTETPGCNKNGTADSENQPPVPPQIQVQEDNVRSEQDPGTPANNRTKKLDGGDQAKTPISALLLSIEEGFMVSPVRPLSPPEKYLHLDPNADGGFRFGIPKLTPISQVGT